MHKFFVSPDAISNKKAVIDGDDVKHIYKVLRLKAGDEVIINNSQGKEYLGRIHDVNKSTVVIDIIEAMDINNESNLKVDLYQGLPKSAKMDYIVQKGTEIGINKITPIITERVIVKSELGEFKKTDRWRRIALEACKQSKRTLIPEINEPIEFQFLLTILKNYDIVVVPYENQEGFGIKKMCKSLQKEVKSAAVVIGPEGGFEEEEIKSLKDIGGYIVTLGPRILRTETAGIVTAALLQYELGDLGGFINE
ncbi:16S rRNA (uracil(1498)-N(3))-methyltransferase [Clostridium thermarum]|uniref:16S rRNA (uracil(1498)-N(3))-methyltransferase n=1 Tax=Clostridium thermarum TaxID=1716543 RepID=UPI0013D17F3F|nr:16S rRNA (uracil(1498)-N(3))-methyltransferase [Clostridium thermarum]